MIVTLPVSPRIEHGHVFFCDLTEWNRFRFLKISSFSLLAFEPAIQCPCLALGITTEPPFLSVNVKAYPPALTAFALGNTRSMPPFLAIGRPPSSVNRTFSPNWFLSFCDPSLCFTEFTCSCAASAARAAKPLMQPNGEKQPLALWAFAYFVTMLS